MPGICKPLLHSRPLVILVEEENGGWWKESGAGNKGPWFLTGACPAWEAVSDVKAVWGRVLWFAAHTTLGAPTLFVRKSLAPWVLGA